MSLLGEEGERLLALNALRAADAFSDELYRCRMRQGRRQARSLISRYAAAKAAGVALNPVMGLDLAGGVVCDSALVMQLCQIYGLPMTRSGARRLLFNVGSQNALLGGTQLGLQALLGGVRQALLLAAVLCEAAYAVIGKRLTAVLSPKRISAIINLWGFVLSTPAGLYAAWHFSFGAVPAPMWALLLFYALAACMWTVWLWMTGLRAVPAAQAGIFTVLLPVSAAVVGMLVLGEQISSLQLLALGIALLGVVVATWPARRPA
jgi:hypothetical protein